ncbi:AmmeMemoRadiSam system protein B [Bifidobacterium sp. SO4]|uniref:AmmeMemoRadiSam system protein B n=1 Tax=Bifidobacterium sp. SO4 TaxID=2809030 RepID=UPI001F0AB57D|nr:AmmeMemoRadiSam system protein B [Bifidobacterium sp. SO4]
MVHSDIFHGNNGVHEPLETGAAGPVAVRPAAVAGSFYPADQVTLKQLVNRHLDYGRALIRQLASRLPAGAPKAVIVPHAGYVYSGTTAALAYALLERGRGMVKRAVIVGPTHRVAVRGVACSTWDAFETPLGAARVDTAAERRALGMGAVDTTDATGSTDVSQGVSRNVSRGVSRNGLRSGMRARPGAPAPALIVNDPTHAQEHAVEVQIPFLQTIFGPDLEIVPLNAGDATPEEVGDVLRALWGDSETVIVISSDLSHYHPQAYARALDDQTIEDILALRKPIHPRRACGAYPINGLLDVLTERHDMHLFKLGCSTSGDDGVVALAGQPRPAMRDPDEPVVGYASFAAWEDGRNDGASDDAVPDEAGHDCTDRHDGADIHGGFGVTGSADAIDGADRGSQDSGTDTSPADSERGDVLLALARAAIQERLGIDTDTRRPTVSDTSVGVNADVDPVTDISKSDAGPTGAIESSVSDIIAAHPWLWQSGASFVTLTEYGRLRGCIGSLVAYRSLGRDVAEHAVDAAVHDPRFNPVTVAEYPLLSVEVSVLGEPEPVVVTADDEISADGKDEREAKQGYRHALADGSRPATTNVSREPRHSDRPVRSRAELESALRPGRDGLIISDQGGRSATFLPQVWEQLPDPHDFVAHLLAKAGIRPGYDWSDGEIDCQRYEVTAYAEE